MDRKEALALLQSKTSNEQLFFHSLETEAIMRAIAADKGYDVDKWGLAGLLHDIDLEETRDTPDQHGMRGAAMLKTQGFPEDVLHAVQSHNAEYTGVKRESVLDHSLACAETITGLIAATVMVHPERNVRMLKNSSVGKKFKDKTFARNVRREIIMECERIGYDLASFIALSVKAIQLIADEIHF